MYDPQTAINVFGLLAEGMHHGDEKIKIVKESSQEAQAQTRIARANDRLGPHLSFVEKAGVKDQSKSYCDRWVCKRGQEHQVSNEAYRGREGVHGDEEQAGAHGQMPD